MNLKKKKEDKLKEVEGEKKIYAAIHVLGLINSKRVFAIFSLLNHDRTDQAKNST